MPGMGSSSGVVSETLRKEGNRLYKMVSDEQPVSMCLLERRVRATCADEIYLQALHDSLTWDDRASCCKNLGVLNILRTKLQLQHALNNQESHSFNSDLDLCKQYLLRSVSFLLQAKRHGTRAGKTKDWVAHLKSSIDEAVDWAIVESSNCDLSFEKALFSLNGCEAGGGGRYGSFNGDLEIYMEEARDLVIEKVQEKLKMLQEHLRQVQEEEEEEARRRFRISRTRPAQVDLVSIQLSSVNISAPSFYTPVTPSSYVLLQQYYQFF
ncbi:hypothetical protein GOP47_0005648 [Adiantum capillus-veneris]|uniref:Uncharacterized protein n=1 Tax=Adiantum capillus-veneris TaxID=13818 RepID=A0A9D4ZLS5_ADICA|nr:hypothetical protein GOP47_0005648 [Adiantum capillus-veneris]